MQNSVLVVFETVLYLHI